MDNSFTKRIIALRDADFQLREKLARESNLGESYNTEMEQLHNHNADTLNNIIDEIGYPTIGKVGKEASEAAWIVIQHAIGKPEFMKKSLRMLEDAVNQNEASPVNLAYLSDRIATLEGRPQLYGTQFDWDKDGELSPQPYDDWGKVNDRRKLIGLTSLDEQTITMRKNAKLDNLFSPEDFEERKKEVEEWRKKVGWK
jgi:hypothetical protein